VKKRIAFFQNEFTVGGIQKSLLNLLSNFDYDKFVKKYKFTHLVVEASSLFNEYLEDNANYELVYSSYYNEGGKRLLYQNVYTLK
jgi:hypothetical protein